MKKPLTFLLLSTCLWAPGGLTAVTLSTGNDPQGNACDIVGWTDAAGQPRMVWIKKSNPGGFITRYTWVNNGTPVDARVRENYPPWGFLVLVNHWKPDTTGNYVTSCNAANLTVPLSSSVPFHGAHHLIWRGTFRMKMDPADTISWYNTVQYVFTDGRNDFLFSTAYDSSDMAEAKLQSDMRSPYSVQRRRPRAPPSPAPREPSATAPCPLWTRPRPRRRPRSPPMGPLKCWRWCPCPTPTPRSSRCVSTVLQTAAR
jgi:hypothetical protein